MWANTVDNALGHNDKAVHILKYKTLTQEWIWFHEIIHGQQHLGNKASKYADFFTKEFPFWINSNKKRVIYLELIMLKH